MNLIPNRLSWEEYAIYISIAAEGRSEDPTTQVGACILNNRGKVLTTGYNGFKQGMKVDDSLFLHENRVRKAKLIHHAEANAFKFLKDTDEPYLIGTTWSPCSSCAQQIACRDIKKVVFVNDYIRDQEYVDIFKFYNISFTRLSDESLDRIIARFELTLQKAKNLRKS